MPSPLVAAFRALLLEREEEGRMVTPPERAMLLATLARYDHRTGFDAVEELEAAIAHARRVCLSEPAAGADPDLVERTRRDAVRRLLGAARGVLDYHPPEPPQHDVVDEPADDDTTRRPFRADVDG